MDAHASICPERKFTYSLCREVKSVFLRWCSFTRFVRRMVECSIPLCGVSFVHTEKEEMFCSTRSEMTECLAAKLRVEQINRQTLENRLESLMIKSRLPSISPRPPRKLSQTKIPGQFPSVEKYTSS